MKAKIITVGDELLIGQVVDTNSAWIGEQMNNIGVEIVEIISIKDDDHAIKHVLKNNIGNVDILLMTGGLGPTKDDITKKSIAEFLNDTMVFHEESYERIMDMFQKLKRTPTADHKNQCYMPSKAKIMTNKMGTAPGMWFQHQGTIIVSMPGVPYEMKYLVENEVIPRVKPLLGDVNIIHKTILTIGEGETRLAAEIDDILQDFPENMKIAYLPSLGTVRLRLSVSGKNRQLLDEQLSHFTALIANRLADYVYGYNKEILEENIGKLAIEKQKTIGLAESCTGGSIAQKITSISGSSQYFLGGIVAYSNQMKMNILNVSPKTLEKYGAVSRETVKEMAEGTLKCVQSDIAIAVSGIAGPTGATPTKPVGTMWLAIGNKDKIETVHLELSKDRTKNIEYTTTVAMNMLRKFLLRN